jgi:preprotein translocase subunit Sec61beta
MATADESGAGAGPGLGLRAELRTPRSAAVAGIAFALILGTVIVLFRSAGPGADDGLAWLDDAGRREAVQTALNLVPFAGIAFLWFIGVIRARLGEREDKLFATVFLGSGLLFVVTLFVGSASIAAVLIVETGPTGLAPSTVLIVEHLGMGLLATFGSRMAAVFVLSVTSVGMRTRLVPRWMVAIGYAVALVLLLSPPVTRWSQLLFPGWVLLLSVYFLVADPSHRAPAITPQV